MKEFVPFITEHWVLSVLWIACLAMLLVNEFLQNRLGAKNITPEQAIQLINHQNAVVLDIRSDSVFAEGHILGAEHVVGQRLEKKIKNLHKHIEKPIIIVCATGRDSPKLAAELQQKGFVQTVVLNGGMQAWKAVGLPLVKS